MWGLRFLLPNSTWFHLHGVNGCPAEPPDAVFPEAAVSCARWTESVDGGWGRAKQRPEGWGIDILKELMSIILLLNGPCNLITR